MSQTVTHKDLARKLKVSETTIKSYRRKFEDCIPVASNGKPIRFLPEAVAVCTLIRDLFDLGMSVEEVRARLAQEFTWISLVAKKEDPDQPTPIPGLPQEFTIALSNLAKSMVNLSQQQNAIIERMERLETALADLPVPQESGGMKASEFRSLLEDLQGYLRNALMPLQQLQRLNEVQSVTEVLHHAAGSMVDAAQILRGLSSKSKNQDTTETSQKVVAFSPNSQAPFVPTLPASPPPAPPQDPPRAFLLKPMVVRTVEGAYIGAGGKSRGRFTLNDFKALLVYGRQPGEHFSLQWEQNGNDWTATLSQPHGEKSGKWQMQFKEAMSQSGVGIVELMSFTANDEPHHPAEFVGFVAELAGV